MILKLRKSKAFKWLCFNLVFCLLFQVCLPVNAFALTAGASAPEFSSFEPVGTTDMVNDFTGDFTYNIPVLNIPGSDGGGYSMSLSYHSGSSSETEASWVGFGWTLNPGSINRNKRGYPDDFKGAKVVKYNKSRPNWTQSARFDVNMEYNSKDDPEKKEADDKKNDDPAKGLRFLDGKLNVQLGQIPAGGYIGQDDDDPKFSNVFGLSLSKSIVQNNYSGISISSSIGGNYKGMASLNLSRSGGQNTLGYSINPSILLEKKSTDQKEDNKKVANQKFDHDKSIKAQNTLSERIKGLNYKQLTQYPVNLLTSHALRTFNAPSLPYSVSYNVGRSINFSGSVQINPVGPIGFQLGLAGNLNTQIPIPKETVKAYGHMYPRNHDHYVAEGLSKKKNYYDLNNNQHPIETDFQIEKPTTFNKHDKNLGIPFSNADIYSATGNGVVGGFQLKHVQLGHYYPNPQMNRQKINAQEIEVGVGQTVTAGIDISLGKQTTRIDQWKKPDGTGLEFNEDLPFMRFTGDMGGELRYSDHNDLQYATIEGINRNLNFDLFEDEIQLDTDNHGKSSAIEYALFNEGSSLLNNPFDPVYDTLKGVADQIGQIKITNKDGSQSTYGLPVFTKEEKELTIELGKNNFEDGAYLSHKQALEYTDPLKNSTAVGSHTPTPYASTYLLTQNTTFDYVDIGNDGLDNKDFGGWTKFSYRKAHGGSDINSDVSDWYRYRAPYTGLIYNRGRLFDGRDQTGSMSSGYKEVYYLNYIETKTHLAFFVTNKTQGNKFDELIHQVNPGLSIAELNELYTSLTGSGTSRLDGLDAISVASNLDLAAANPNSKGNHELEKLERIVLYAKSDLSQAISTSFFEYDHSLCKGLPNSIGTASQSGKLTLKRVWTESGGTYKSRISPYQFHYAYRNSYPTEVTGKYGDLLSSRMVENYYANLEESDQNPIYKPERLDMWGYYQENGANRFANMIPWVSQKAPLNTFKFDPAAWQLKRIVLPSGGEINVQYEQKDYTHVQDEQAMAMLSLKSNSETINGYKSGVDENKYFINTSDIGLNTSDIDRYIEKLRKHFVDKGEKLYFKILYGYVGVPTSILSSNYASHFKKSDYITGWTTVNEVGRSGDDIFLSLGELKNNGNSKKDETLPRWVCYKQLLTNAGYVLMDNSDYWENTDDEILSLAYSDSDNNGTLDVIENTNESDGDHPLKKIGKSNAISGTMKLFGGWVNGNIRNVPKKDACKQLNYDFSYFRLPVFKEKKGGGIRVHRILSYDPGIETGVAMVYGSEYLYQMPDGTSSGVATNEPPQGIEENALNKFHERRDQKGLDKLLNGFDAKVYAGIIGESLYPAAQVAHQRVVIKNIHDGKSSTGYQVNRYHTVKEHPSVEVEYSKIDKDNDTYKKFNLSLPLGLFNYSQQKYWIAQGYNFKINDMHGKPKDQLVYAGNYTQDQFIYGTYISGTSYRYSPIGEPINSVLYDPVSKTFKEEVLSLGEEEELAMYSSCVDDVTNDGSLEIDLNISLTTSITLGFAISYNLTDQSLCQHVTSKVIHQKSYLLATTNFADGIAQTTENIAFDRYTGDPVLTRTYDSYGKRQIYAEQSPDGKHAGEYYNLNMPAAWIYEAMAAKDEQHSDRSNQLTASAGSITTYGTNPIDELNANGELKDVVSASTTVFQKDWFTNNNENAVILNQEFLSGTNANERSQLNEHYYPLRTYVYADGTNSKHDGGRLYNSGLVSNVPVFDWLAPHFHTYQGSNWFSPSEVLSYSPHGYPIEERDTLGIRSTAKFGYDKTLPILVAQNADYQSVHFIDFEYKIPYINEVNKSKTAHSGYHAYNLSQDPMFKILDDAILSNTQLEKGISVKLWLNSQLSRNPNDPNFGLRNPNPQLQANVNGHLHHFDLIAQTGEWCLYEAIIEDWQGLQVGNTYDLSLSYAFQANEEVMIDDIRIQPQDAVMNCTVYYPDFTVAAQFDDQHFGVFYEYNAERQLVRKSIETQRGRKTLQEQQYNIPKVLR